MKSLPAGGVAVPASEVHTVVCSLILENADRSGIVVYMPRRLHCNLDNGDFYSLDVLMFATFSMIEQQKKISSPENNQISIVGSPQDLRASTTWDRSNETWKLENLT